MESRLVVDVDMCYCDDPCIHSVRVGDGAPVTMCAPYIVALQQVLNLPVDTHFNRILQDPKWTNEIAIARSSIVDALGLSPIY